MLKFCLLSDESAERLITRVYDDISKHGLITLGQLKLLTAGTRSDLHNITDEDNKNFIWDKIEHPIKIVISHEGWIFGKRPVLLINNPKFVKTLNEFEFKSYDILLDNISWIYDHIEKDGQISLKEIRSFILPNEPSYNMDKMYYKNNIGFNITPIKHNHHFKVSINSYHGPSIHKSIYPYGRSPYIKEVRYVSI